MKELLLMTYLDIVIDYFSNWNATITCYVRLTFSVRKIDLELVFQLILLVTQLLFLPLNLFMMRVNPSMTRKHLS
jgi:hypothetical protein